MTDTHTKKKKKHGLFLKGRYPFWYQQYHNITNDTQSWLEKMHIDQQINLLPMHCQTFLCVCHNSLVEWSSQSHGGQVTSLYYMPAADRHTLKDLTDGNLSNG